MILKNKVWKYIDEKKDEFLEMSDYIFDNPELGLQEFKAVNLLTDHLEKKGFSIERGLGGFETAFRAVFSNNINDSDSVPSIGLLCEYDALENLGHACAHNMQGPAILLAAEAIKETIKNLPYKLVIYGTPAEETIGGKIKMVEEGFFNDIDVALMMHGSSTTTTDIKSLAMTNFNVDFFGKSSHAALSPEKGRSALDGILLFFQGIEFLREHIKDGTRIHYTISNAGGPANVVPEFAQAKISIRSYERPYLDSVIERVKNIVQGAALMTETDSKMTETKKLDNKIPVLGLNNLLMKNADLSGSPRISPPREKTGSTDFGNVMYMVPGTCIRVAFVNEDATSHSKEYLDMGKTSQAHDAIIYGSKILSGAAIDMIENNEVLEAIKNEFLETKKKMNKI
ncbi:MAG: M20 family metallopeptidase [Fusobacteriaceae bacterium]